MGLAGFVSQATIEDINARLTEMKKAEWRAKDPALRVQSARDRLQGYERQYEAQQEQLGTLKEAIANLEREVGVTLTKRDEAYEELQAARQAWEQ